MSFVKQVEDELGIFKTGQRSPNPSMCVVDYGLWLMRNYKTFYITSTEYFVTSNEFYNPTLQFGIGTLRVKTAKKT